MTFVAYCTVNLYLEAFAEASVTETQINRHFTSVEKPDTPLDVKLVFCAYTESEGVLVTFPEVDNIEVNVVTGVCS